MNALAKKLIRKLPETTRYTKQQLNFLKDLAWHSTVRHAQDWLSLHYACWEPLEGMRVVVRNGLVVSPTSRYGEFALLAEADGRTSITHDDVLESEFFGSAKVGVVVRVAVKILTAHL